MKLISSKLKVKREATKIDCVHFPKEKKYDVFKLTSLPNNMEPM